MAADYLLRSEDYETALFTCSECGLTAFDARRASVGVCRSHAAALQSDIRELGSASGSASDEEGLPPGLANVG